MGKYTLGISKIEVGNVANDGGPGTTLAQLGLTMEGTGKLNQDDPTTTDFRVEEQDQPVVTISIPGAISLDFSIANPDIDTMIALFGGTATGTAPNRTYNLPASIPALEQTVKVTPKQGFSAIVVPRGSITAKLNGELTRNNLFVIDVSVKALTPTKTGVGPLQFAE